MKHTPGQIETHKEKDTVSEVLVPGQEQDKTLENLQTKKEAVREERQKQKEEQQKQKGELEKELAEQEESPQVVEEEKESVTEKENKPKKRQSRWGKMKKLFSLKGSWRGGSKRITSASGKSDSWR